MLGALLLALVGGAGAGGRGSREEGGLHGEAVAIGEWMLGQGMDLYYSGKDPHACAKMLRGAVRVGAGRKAADPALAPRADHLVLQARLFLANLLAQSRTPTGMRAAEELYLNALRAASPGANTLASVSKENLGASRRHVPGAHTSPERFLVFRFWAGLSNRRQELIGVMAAAKLLGRTLVLPDIVEGRWMASHGSDRPKLPVSAIYEEVAMKGFVATITEQAFQALVQPLLLFFITLVTGPRRSWSLKLSDTKVYEPQIRARLGTTAHFCRVVVLKLSAPCRQAPSLPPVSAELFVRDYAYIGQLAHLGLWSARILRSSLHHSSPLFSSFPDPILIFFRRYSSCAPAV